METVLKVGDIYRIKPGQEHLCSNYEARKGKYIKLTGFYGDENLEYDILDENKEKMRSCFYCFSKNHLLPLEEEVKKDNRFKIGNVLQYNGYTRKVLYSFDVPDGLYVLSKEDMHDKAFGLYTHQEIVTENGLVIEEKEMTLEEVSKELGYTVKIKE
jgi:hypothetical protein